MSAQNYHLVVSALGGTPYISKVNDSKKTMKDDRREIPRGEFLQAIHHWLENEVSNAKDKTSVITVNGKPIMELKLLSK